MRSTLALAVAGSLSLARATYQGFNYASTKADGAIMELSDWKAAFDGQKALAGTDGKFTSARLYTMVKDSKNRTPAPILAFQAAADDSDISLLLGVWCSAGQNGVNAEIAALKAAMEQFPNLASQIAGISVGSEDLYRVSKIANKTNEENPDKPLGPGAFPNVMLSYVEQVKGNLTGSWADIPVGHVDTWTAFTNDDGSFNQDDLTLFIAALDFLGVDSYPYFQGTMPNDITASTDLFNEAYQRVVAVAGSAQIWITETGWPSSGDTINLAKASADNARTYWRGVGCANFGKINTWWYTFHDAGAEPSFGVSTTLAGDDTVYDLSCSGYTDGPDAATATVSSASKTTAKEGTNGTSGGNTTTSGTGGRSSSTSSAGSSPTKGSSGSNQDSSGATMVTMSSVLALGVAVVAALTVL